MQINNLQALLPKATVTILKALNVSGYEAYLVGGAVRDLLLNKIPTDFDITTNAQPQQILEICKKNNWHTVDNLGRNFGCIMIVIDNYPTEVTTFRGESYTKDDAHRPAATWYCKTLREDLSRRDFTINAMALDLHGNLYDYFNGYEDLQKKILRTVGDSTTRYIEDALRMFRACRFIAQLGFNYIQSNGDCGTFGMKDTPYYLKHSYKFPINSCTKLSLERVRKEMDKILIAPYAGKGLMMMMSTGLFASSCRVRINGKDFTVPLLPEILHLVNLKQNPKFHLYDVWEHTLLAIDNSPQILNIRWSLLLHDLGKGLPNVRKLNKDGQPSDPGHELLSAKIGKDILKRWQYPQQFIKLTTWLISQHMHFAPVLINGSKNLLHWIRTEATKGNFHNQKELIQAYKLLVEVFLADMGATHARENSQLMLKGKVLGKQVIELAEKYMPVSTSDLKISNQELLKLIPQSKFKEILPYLLERVQNGNLLNTDSTLLAAVKKKIEREKKDII